MSSHTIQLIDKFAPGYDDYNVASFAVLHFLGNLQHLFADVAKNLNDGGIFGFSAYIYKSNQDLEYSETSIPGVYIKTQESGLSTYKHSMVYLHDI